MTMEIKIWGTRGSRPTPKPSHLKYGGNTTCAQIISVDELILIDSGTGMSELSDYMLSQGKFAVKGKLFQTHGHTDHITGFPFFVPFYIPGTEMTVYGANRGVMEVLIDEKRRSDTGRLTKESLEEKVCNKTRTINSVKKPFYEQQKPENRQFPVPLEGLNAQINFTDLSENDVVESGNVRISYMNGIHPQGVAIYKFQEGNKTIVF